MTNRNTLAENTSCLPSSAATNATWLNYLFAVTSGLAVANVYFAQPLLEIIALSLNVAVDSIGIVVTATQVGYAIGLLFLVPLGDILDRKKLISLMLITSTVALIAVACAPGFAVLLAAMVTVGLMAVVVQIFVAYASTLASPDQRGKAVGTVTSGVVLGILLARFVAGAMADLAGWRAVYLLSSGLIFVMTLILLKALPSQPRAQASQGYRQLLTSVLSLFLTLKILRVRAILALLIFMSFSILWTSLALPLTATPFYMTHTQIGMFGFAGIAGALAASRAGKWADKGFAQRVTGIALAILFISWLPMGMANHSVLLLIAGVILLDFAVQAVHVTNQSLIFAARPDATSRLVGAYMFFYSVGSGIGAIAATQVYAHWGWHGVCLLGAMVSLSALLFWLLTRK